MNNEAVLCVALVKNKREKGKIGTKPDQIKKKGKRGEAEKSQEQSSYARATIELWVDVELKDSIVVKCPKNPGLGVGAGETNNLKNTSQAPKGFLLGSKMAFKPTQEYRPVTKSILLTLAVVKRKVWTLLVSKFEDSIIDGQATLMDKAGNPLKKVEYLGDHDSKDKVESVDNDMACSLLPKGLDLALKVCWNNGRILMEIVTMMKTRTMMICMKDKIYLKRFKLYAISWTSEFEVARSNRVLFLLSSYFCVSSFKEVVLPM
nr:hypothetical protein [Tanacetum cinerariifolium]